MLVIGIESFVGMDLADVVESLGCESAQPVISLHSATLPAAERAPDDAIVDVTSRTARPGRTSRLAAIGTQVLALSANPEFVVEGVGGVAAVLTKTIAHAYASMTLPETSVLPVGMLRADPNPNWLLNLFFPAPRRPMS